MRKIPKQVLDNFMIDHLPEIPEASLVEYNIKLLEVD